MAEVVVIEDDPQISALLVAHFTKRGDSVTSFGRAQTALEHLGGPGANTELVMVDLGLPDMSGFEFIVKARAQKASAETIIVVISARTGLQERARALDVGADDFVEKPFNLKAVEKKVRGLLDS